MSARELIERLEKLYGPDRDVDALIAIYFDEPHGPREDVHLESRSYTIIDEQAKRYTASLDAANALVEKVRPGWRGSLHWRNDGAFVRLSHDTLHGRHSTARASTKPIALLIALLRSLSPTEGE